MAETIITSFITFNLNFQSLTSGVVSNTATVKTQIDKPLNFHLSFQDIEPVTTKDIICELVPTVRTGWSPLTIEFTPTFTFDGDTGLSIKNNYSLKEIHFSYTTSGPGTLSYQETIAYNNASLLTAIPPFNFLFRGYKGKTFDIGVEAVLINNSQIEMTTELIVKPNLIICGYSPKEVLPAECITDYKTIL